MPREPGERGPANVGQDATVAMYCLGCGYDVHGLDVCRCPECGRGFDPQNPESFATAPERAAGWVRRVIERIFAWFVIGTILYLIMIAVALVVMVLMRLVEWLLGIF